jgi:hypothetical protein
VAVWADSHDQSGDIRKRRAYSNSNLDLLIAGNLALRKAWNRQFVVAMRSDFLDGVIISPEVLLITCVVNF